MPIKQLPDQYNEGGLTRSRISDYCFFVIGMTLMLLSNFSDLGNSEKLKEESFDSRKEIVLISPIFKN
jgi:hypothetical protein